MKMTCPTCGHTNAPHEVVFDDTCIITIDDTPGFDELVTETGDDWFHAVTENDRENLPFTRVAKFREYLLACTDLIIEHEKGHEFPDWSWN